VALICFGYLCLASIGSFIVRPSDSTPGDYSLSVRVSQTVSRFRIQHQKHQYIMGGRLFDRSV
jgi:Ras GTPase-activating protein 1